MTRVEGHAADRFVRILQVSAANANLCTHRKQKMNVCFISKIIKKTRDLIPLSEISRCDINFH